MQWTLPLSEIRLLQSMYYNGENHTVTGNPSMGNCGRQVTEVSLTSGLYSECFLTAEGTWL